MTDGTWEMSEDEKNRILAALTRVGALKACPRCSNKSWQLVPAYVNPVLQPSPSTVRLAGLVVPSVYVICTRCGFMSQHAIAMLGLMPDGRQTDEAVE